MVDEPKNQSQSSKSPQEELDELLRQSQVTRPTSGIKLPETSPNRAANWLVIGIVGLAGLLVVGTGYVLLSGVKFNTAQLVLELNTDQVQLTVDDHSAGTVNSGDVLRVRAGQHTLEATKAGFLDLHERVELARNQQLTVNLALLPIPEIETVVDHPVDFARLNLDGSEIAYFDDGTKTFQAVKLEDGSVATLFRGSFSGVQDVVWSPVGQAALVKLVGRPTLPNTLDNRSVKGRYIPLGTPGGRPDQAPAKFGGVSTWLFDDDRKPAAGWQPILLNDSICQAAFNADGGSIIYLYDTANGEYSLVQAWPDGLEWERLIVEMPRFTDPRFSWGADDRYVLVQDNNKLSLLDMVDKTLSEPFPDYVAGSQLAVSTAGDKVAYLADADGAIKLKIYDLVTSTAKVLDTPAVSGKTSMVWTGTDSVIVALDNQTFELIETDQDVHTTIPFVGASIDLQVQRMEYSLAAKVLMLVTDRGVAMMKV